MTNEDYVNALVHFANGDRGMVESCRVINGAKGDMSFEIHGTNGAIKWTMARMNELQLQWRNEANPAEDGYTTLLSGPAHPYHRHFNPAWDLNLGYEDLKIIKAYNFLKAIVTGQQGEPGFGEASAPLPMGNRRACALGLVNGGKQLKRRSVVTVGSCWHGLHWLL